MKWLAMYEDEWLTLYIILIFVAFISASSWVRYCLLPANAKHASHGMRGLPRLKANPAPTERREA